MERHFPGWIADSCHYVFYLKESLNNLRNGDIQIIIRRNHRYRVAPFYPGVPQHIHIHRHSSNSHPVKILTKLREHSFFSVNHRYIMTALSQQSGQP